MIVGSEMVERMKVAALCAYIENGGCADIGEHLTHGDQRHVAPDMIGKMMIAALQALMEPTPGMIQAAIDNVGPIGCCLHNDATAAETWDVMIRSAMEGE